MKFKDNYGDKFAVDKRDQEMHPGEVIVRVNDSVGVILDPRDVQRLRKHLKKIERRGREVGAIC